MLLSGLCPLWPVALCCSNPHLALPCILISVTQSTLLESLPVFLNLSAMAL